MSKRSDWGIGLLRVFRDSDPSRTRAKDFHDAHIVLTTYCDVQKSVPKREYPKGIDDADRSAYFQQYFSNTLGILRKINFHSIVMDEGQTIRDPASQTTQAADHLKANHRWILSGSPILNEALM